MSAGHTMDLETTRMAVLKEEAAGGSLLWEYNGIFYSFFIYSLLFLTFLSNSKFCRHFRIVQVFSRFFWNYNLF